MATFDSVITDGAGPPLAGVATYTSTLTTPTGTLTATTTSSDGSVNGLSGYREDQADITGANFWAGEGSVNETITTTFTNEAGEPATVTTAKINFSDLNTVDGVISDDVETFYLIIDGVQVDLNVAIAEGWVTFVNNADSDYQITADGGVTGIIGRETAVGDTGVIDQGEVGSLIINIPEGFSSIGISYTETDGSALGSPNGFLYDIQVDTSTVQLTSGDGIVEGTAGDDLIDAAYTGDPEGDMVDAGDNTLAGVDAGGIAGSNDDLIKAGAGNDIVVAGDGNDTIFAGSGDDSVLGGAGDDVMGVDSINIGLDNNAGNDTMDGGAGNDLIEGGEGNDSLLGGTGSDTIYGSSRYLNTIDNDYIDGGEGPDAMFGGGGQDTIVVGGGDTANGGSSTSGDSDLFVFTGALQDTTTGTITITGGEDSDGLDVDVLDISALGLTKNDITFDPNDPESGTFQYVNDAGDTITVNFSQIEQIVCFARGTMIETAQGPRAIETLAEGDMIVTRDNGHQPLRWIGARALDAAALEAAPKLRPVRIRAGALGDGLPAQDLLVSPQHRVLVRSKIAQKMFGTDEVLVAAKQLCQLDGIDIADDATQVEYFHMLFDRHEIVISNGAETESLYTGPEALKSLGGAALEEIFAIFPELAERDYTPHAARVLASGRMGRKLAVRHAQNHKALVN